MVGHLLSPAIAFIVTPLLARRHNKRNVWIWVSIAATVSYAAPLTLRTMGLFPDNGHPFVFPFLLVNDILGISLAVIAFTLNTSMLMDVVEAREVETGRREEGVIAACGASRRKPLWRSARSWRVLRSTSSPSRCRPRWAKCPRT